MRSWSCWRSSSQQFSQSLADRRTAGRFAKALPARPMLRSGRWNNDQSRPIGRATRIPTTRIRSCPAPPGAPNAKWAQGGTAIHWEKDALPGGSGETPMQPEPEPEIEDETGSGGIVSQLQSLAEPVAYITAPIVDHLVIPMAGRIGTVIEAAEPGHRRNGLAGGQAREAHGTGAAGQSLRPAVPRGSGRLPRELGVRASCPWRTSMAPSHRRHGTARRRLPASEALPRPRNWESRWKQIETRSTDSSPCPPWISSSTPASIGSWTATTASPQLYTNGAGLDAMVTELVPLDGHVSEQPTPLLDPARSRPYESGRRGAETRRGLAPVGASDRRRPGRPARPGDCARVDSEAWD